MGQQGHTQLGSLLTEPQAACVATTLLTGKMFGSAISSVSTPVQVLTRGKCQQVQSDLAGWRDIEPSLLQKHEVVTDVSLRRVILAKVLSSVNTNLPLCTPHQSFNVQIMRQARGQVWQFLFLVFSGNKTGIQILYQFISFIDTIDLIKFQGGGTVKILLDLL